MLTSTALLIAASSRGSSLPSGVTSRPIQSIRKRRFSGVSSIINGLSPDRVPGRSVVYRPPSPRRKTSAPRSLSKKTIRGVIRCACASRKLRTTVFPDPDGPITVKLPRSPLWKLK